MDRRGIIKEMLREEDSQGLADVANELQERITAVEGELEELKSKGITHVYRGTPMDLDAVAEMLDKEKGEKIEALGKVLDQATTSTAHWLKSFKSEQKKNQDLQATLDQIREAAKPLIKLCDVYKNYSYNKIVAQDGLTVIQPKANIFHVIVGDLRAFEQACSEGEKVYAHSIRCSTYMSPAMEEAGRVPDDCDCPKKPPCPDCGGWKYKFFKAGVPNGVEPCKTCNPKGRVDNAPK